MANAGLNQTISELWTSLQSLGQWLLYLAILFLVLGLVGYLLYNKRRWNIKVEFKMWRSNGNYLRTEWGKGRYSAKKGHTVLKRPGLSGAKYIIKGFDVRQFLESSDTLTVIQTGPDSFIPAIPESFLKINDENNREIAIMNLEADTTSDNNWAAQQYTTFLNTYTIKNFLKDSAQWIGMGLVIAIILISQYVGFGALIDRMQGG
jgi:hypothetical protein